LVIVQGIGKGGERAKKTNKSSYVPNIKPPTTIVLSRLHHYSQLGFLLSPPHFLVFPIPPTSKWLLYYHYMVLLLDILTSTPPFVCCFYLKFLAYKLRGAMSIGGTANVNITSSTFLQNNAHGNAGQQGGVFTCFLGARGWLVYTLF
jgi:hypothetical protein